MIAYRFHKREQLNDVTSFEYPVSEFKQIHDQILHSTREQRLEMDGMIEMRVDMIVIASILVNMVACELNIGTIHSSYYALKEGVLKDILNV
jgi:exopolyphosphatase/guanosine-5'-triphosphate,3'-diphosphate pyrophosphatase